MDNKKNNVVLITVISLITIVLLIFFIPRKKFHERINDIRKKTVPMFDSLSNKIAKDNNFLANINLLIEHDELPLACLLIDSAIKKNPTKEIYYVYKGMVYAREKKYQKAIQVYDSAMRINNSEFPLALSKKAEALVDLKDYNKAIESYKKAASSNADFNYQVASTFELINEKDSALKYFIVFRERYPDDKLVAKKIQLLSK